MALKALDQRLAGGASSPAARVPGSGPSAGVSRPPAALNGEAGQVGDGPETVSSNAVGDEEAR